MSPTRGSPTKWDNTARAHQRDVFQAGVAANGVAERHSKIVDMPQRHHGFMTVYYELDPLMRLPMVPIVMNCTTPPLMTLRHVYNFGVALGDAIRSYPGLERVALVGAGGLSHFVGEPRVGDIDEEFDRWFLDQLESGDLDNLLDIPNDELMLAGNGTGEVRSWVTVAAAMRGYKAKSLAYEPIYEWINGMGVVLYEGATQ